MQLNSDIDWKEYMKRVLHIVEHSIVCNSKNNNVALDANSILSVKDYISRQVSFYQSRWVDHQKYGVKTPEQFAALFGYKDSENIEYSTSK